MTLHTRARTSSRVADRYAGCDCVIDASEWVQFCECELAPHSREPQRQLVERYRRDFAQLAEKERTPSARERRLLTLDSLQYILLFAALH